jgi:hypothetical protein
MPANSPHRENDLIQGALSWLRERVPVSWAVELSNRHVGAADADRGDAAIEIRAANAYATLVVEARRSLSPRDVERLLGSVGRTLRSLSPHVPILVVAPWLSARTRELLGAEDVNYLDLTGNALVRVDNPALFIQSQGAGRDPSPTPRAQARVRGPKAARLLRTLVDVRPPYGVRELADATGLAPGYVSRLLDALDREALVDRSTRGRVEAVDVAALIRRWSESYDLFASNDAATFLAARGANEALRMLPGLSLATPVAVTGSFAAVRLAPVAAPALLAMYSDDVAALAQALELIPADEGANVALLRPFDQVVWRRAEELDGIRYVAASQAAVDCLTGNGRMPSEGEALLEWMVDHDERWRLNSLADALEQDAA